MKLHLFQIAEAKITVGVMGMGEAKKPDFTFMSPLFPWKVMEYVSVKKKGTGTLSSAVLTGKRSLGTNRFFGWQQQE